MSRALKSLERVLTHRSKNGLRTAVPVFGHGLNVQAAREAGLSPDDDWNPMLRKIAEELGITADDFAQIPESAPLRWDALVERQAISKQCTLEIADESLKETLVSELATVEEDRKTLPLYGRVLSAGFENIISLNIDRRLSLHSDRATFVRERENFQLGYFDRHSMISTSDSATTRIWYPHGDSDDAELIRLGTLDHTYTLRDLENRRSYVMKSWSDRVVVGWTGPEGGNRMGIMRNQLLATPKDFYESIRSYAGWYELLFAAPLVIVGASLPLEEWPIWWMLHQRVRNFVPFAPSAAQKTFYLAAAGQVPRHLMNRPCDIEVVEFPSHDALWEFVLRSGEA